MATNTILVSNSSELSAALKSATGGETILMQGGDYGDFAISGLNFSSNVTIQSYDAENPATFNTLNFNNVSNLTVDSIEVDFHPTASTYSWDSAVSIFNSHDVTFKNSYLEGELATTGSPADTTPGEQDFSGNIIGYPVGRAITVSDSSSVTLENNDVSVFYRGVVLDSVDGVQIVDNSIHDTRISPIAGSDVHNVTVEGNHLSTVTPWSYGGPGDHGDYIHFWIASDQTTNSENILISDNYFAQGTGDSMMGVYIEDHGGTASYFSDVKIDNNLFSFANHQAIRIEGVHGLDITNNTMIQSSGPANEAPGVYLAYGVEDAVIADNVFSAAIGLIEGSEYNKNVVDYNNLIVQNYDPNGANYVGDLFVNALAYDPSVEDLQPVDGGLVDSMNIGSDLTNIDAGNVTNVADNSTTDPVIVDPTVPDSSSTPTDTSTDTSGATDTTGTGTDTSGATDTTGTGTDTSGTTDTTGTGTDTSGTTDTAGTGTDTSGTTDTTGTGTDTSGTTDTANNTDTSVPQTPVVDTPTGTDTTTTDTVLTLDQQNALLSNSANAIGNDVIDLGRGDEYFNTNDFTASFTFKLDEGDDGGRIGWNHMQWGLEVRDDQLIVYFNDEGGKKMDYMFFDNAITDTNWHDVQLVLDDASDTFSVYLDGGLLQTKEDVTGGVGDAKWWDVTVGGSPFGASDKFDGQIADYTILDHAVEVDSSLSVYDRTVAIDSYDDLNSSHSDLVGIATYGHDSIDLA